jgi:hypothetical protein
MEHSFRVPIKDKRDCSIFSYIYTEAVELTLDNAFPVLYLAKKYLLKDLIETVSEFIATADWGKEVTKVLEHLDVADAEHGDW